MFSARLPSKDLLVQACAGTVLQEHPVLLAGLELSNLHATRLEAATVDIPEIDSARESVVHGVDRWVCANGPGVSGAAFLHTETVGMVVDRMAEYSVAAHAALEQGVGEPHLHYLWRRVSELALAYADLVFEVQSGRRRLPDFTDPCAALRR